MSPHQSSLAEGLPSPCTAVFNLLTQKLHRLLGYDSWGRHSLSRQRMLPLDLPLAIHNSATSNCGLWWPRNPLNRPAENRVDKRLLPPVLAHHPWGWAPRALLGDRIWQTSSKPAFGCGTMPSLGQAVFQARAIPNQQRAQASWLAKSSTIWDCCLTTC